MPFDDGNLYDGEVKSFDRETGYRVSYSDGTQQDYAILELSRDDACSRLPEPKLGAITLLLLLFYCVTVTENQRRRCA